MQKPPMAKPTPGLVSAFNPCGGRAHPGGNVLGGKPWGVSPAAAASFKATAEPTGQCSGDGQQTSIA